MSFNNCPVDFTYGMGCKDNVGGNSKIFIRNFSGSTNWNADSTGLLTGGTNTSAAFYTFEQRTETASFDAGDAQISNENGTVYYNQTCGIVLHKYQATLRDILYTLAQTECDIIVLDNNGKYYLMGEEAGATVSAGKATTGKGYGDLNGATITFTAKERWPAREISPVFISTLNFVNP